MVLVMKIDVQDICVADQLCAGTKACVDAAVHAMRDLFEANETEDLLLINASNVFNALNYSLAVSKWPPIHKVRIGKTPRKA